MTPRHNTPITAERLLDDISAQMEHLLKFLEIDLTPAIVKPSSSEDYNVVDLISHGASSRLWISRLQTLIRWSSLALDEEEWLRKQGLVRGPPGNHIRGVWLMPSYLRHIGRSNDHNIRSDLQQGRKLRRLESELGPGIALLFIPVLPSIRRLSLSEEVRTIQLLRSDHLNILYEARMLYNLRTKYQQMVAWPRHSLLPMTNTISCLGAAPETFNRYPRVRIPKSS